MFKGFTKKTVKKVAETVKDEAAKKKNEITSAIKDRTGDIFPIVCAVICAAIVIAIAKKPVPVVVKVVVKAAV